jgi:hypothetical protein
METELAITTRHDKIDIARAGRGDLKPAVDKLAPITPSAEDGIVASRIAARNGTSRPVSSSANRQPRARLGLDAEALSAKKPGLIHAQVLLHGNKGPWKNRPGFDEIGAAVTGLFTTEGTLTRPKSPPIIPIVDNVVGWLGTVGVLAALRRRAVEGGSYRVTVSLTRTVLWLVSLGIRPRGIRYRHVLSSRTRSHAALEYHNRRPERYSTPGAVDARQRYIAGIL